MSESWNTGGLARFLRARNYRRFFCRSNRHDSRESRNSSATHFFTETRITSLSWSFWGELEEEVFQRIREIDPTLLVTERMVAK